MLQEETVKIIMTVKTRPELLILAMVQKIKKNIENSCDFNNI